jgi:phosphofructokinase-like protein
MARKRIGIMTTGGDCAGLNAVIRGAVLRAADGFGWEIIGIRDGTKGLMADPPVTLPLSPDMFSGGILRMGGTLIGTTSSGNPFDFPMPDGTRKNRSTDIYRGYRALGLDALIAIGGDGSFRIIERLVREGDINVVGIPKTIDNDVVGTENAIGYITAVNVATEALDRLQTTAASHSRVMVLEVMGRDAGHIALSAGVAGGADIILIPEIPYRVENLLNRIHALQESQNRNFFLIVVAEGCRTEDGERITQVRSAGAEHYGGIGYWLAEQLAEATHFEIRTTVLGHVQRGGTPSTTDRVLGAAFGVRAVDLIAAGEFGRVVVWQNRRVLDIPLENVVTRTQSVDVAGDLVRSARGLGISFGDE